MKIAITGTAGRIGRAIHFNLCRNHKIVGIDRAPSSATSHIGDICNHDFLANAFTGADAVIHTAALHAPHVGIIDNAEFIRINIQGTKTIIRAARNCGVGQFVFTSTTALYGHASKSQDTAVWINETTTPIPKTIYHRTKIEAEAILEAEASDDFRVTTLRMSRCFPEPAPLMAYYRLCRGVDARDVAEGHRLALTLAGASYRRFILSGPTPFHPSDCEALKTDPESVLRRKCPSLCELFERRNWALPGSIDRVYDSSLAQTELGWLPKYGFEDVVKMLDAGISEVLPQEAQVMRVSE
jgi:UDP-glucose 4-epimerase